MPALFLFLFKVNVALVLFCLGYYLVLRHLTFYTLNRIYLVAAILFSSLYPNINLSDFAQRHQQLTQPVETVIMNWKAPAENFVKPLYQPNYWQWVEVVFWAGVVLFAVRLTMQLFSLYKLYRQSKPGEVHDHQVRLIRDDISPFSFWRSIYINPSKLSPSELKSVLEHEQVHVSEWHTLDILLAELSTIFYWFNPGVWLMKKAVRENIEFITDRKILQKGTDSKEYQYSLVSVGLAATSNNIVNHFNMSTIKKRIIMMNTKRSAGYNITRYVFLVPVVVALLLIFNLSRAEVEIARHTIKSISTAINHIAIKSGNESQIVKLANLKPTIIKAPVKKESTSADTIYAGKDKNGKKSFLFTSDKSLDSVGYVINGIKSTRKDLLAIDPARIYSVDMVSAKYAKEFIDDASGKSDFLFITTDDSESGKKLKEKINQSFKNGAIARAYHISVNPVIVSSDVAPQASSTSTMAYSINSSSSDSFSVDSNGRKNISKVIVVDAKPKVNVKTSTIVKNQVYVSAMPKTDVTVSADVAPEVITIEGNDRTTQPDGKPRKIFVRGLANNDRLTIDGEGHALFIIDGKETTSLKNVSPEDIQSITVLKDGAAEKQYGEKGKNGVVVITTKKGK